MKVDFSSYSLVLVSDGKSVFSSKKSGLKPLLECVLFIKENKLINCTLYDKVIGLAAAKIICYSGGISKVVTPLSSKKANDYLHSASILLDSKKTVETIFNKDKSDICPMEDLALKIKSDEEFYYKLREIIGV